MKRDVSYTSSLGDEREGDAVHAVAQALRVESVVEGVAEVRVAARAEYFGADFWESPVLLLAHVALRDGSPEARPARLRVVLRLRTEEREVAADAQVCAARVLLVERARVRGLRAFAPRHLELLGREPPTPLLFSPDHAPDAAPAPARAEGVSDDRARRTCQRQPAHAQPDEASPVHRLNTPPTST